MSPPEPMTAERLAEIEKRLAAAAPAVYLATARGHAEMSRADYEGLALAGFETVEACRWAGVEGVTDAWDLAAALRAAWATADEYKHLHAALLVRLGETRALLREMLIDAAARLERLEAVAAAARRHRCTRGNAAPGDEELLDALAALDPPEVARNVTEDER